MCVVCVVFTEILENLDSLEDVFPLFQTRMLSNFQKTVTTVSGAAAPCLPPFRAPESPTLKPRTTCLPRLQVRSSALSKTQRVAAGDLLEDGVRLNDGQVLKCLTHNAWQSFTPPGHSDGAGCRSCRRLRNHLHCPAREEEEEESCSTAVALHWACCRAVARGYSAGRWLGGGRGGGGGGGCGACAAVCVLCQA